MRLFLHKMRIFFFSKICLTIELHINHFMCVRVCGYLFYIARIYVDGWFYTNEGNRSRGKSLFHILKETSFSLF